MDNVYNACKYNKYKYIRTCLITYPISNLDNTSFPQVGTGKS